MEGTLTQVLRVSGSLSGASGITGALSGVGTVTGSLSADAQAAPYYDGEYRVIPALDAQVLPTNGKRMRDDVVVTEIPYYETSNPQGGYTAIIGGN